MYSLMMMATLSTAPSGPEFNGYFRNLFNYGGCCGSTSASYGSCNGGVFHGRILRAFSFGGSSCYGSCYGKSTGCSGSGSASCNGSAAYSSCAGCSGSMAYPSTGCSGSTAMEYGMPMESGGGCFGNGAPPIYGGGFPMGTTPMIAPPNLPTQGVPFAPNTPPSSIDEGRFYRANQLPQPGGTASSRATVVVKLPADARLFAEGQPLNLNGGERTFVTPELPFGREYVYSFRIEYERQGEMIANTKKVTVAPGKTSNLNFIELLLGKSNAPKPVAGADRARLTVKLPPGATLFVDGKKNEKPGDVREFTTPPLPAGKEFKYTLMVQVMRNGLPESLSEEVVFHAGEIVPVRDFTAMMGPGKEQRASLK